MSSPKSTLLMYAPRFTKSGERVRAVGRAVIRIAEVLEADVEFLQSKSVNSIWVFYKHDGKEEPIYSDWGKDLRESDVFKALESNLYGLSFLSDHTPLQVIRST